METPQAFRTTRLFLRFTAILVPSFLCAAAVALFFLVRHDATTFEDGLATRLGGAAARIAAGLERHARAAVGADGSPWAAPLPRELTASLLSDPAVVCAALEDTRDGRTLIEAPVGLGCRSAAPDGALVVPVEDAAGAAFALRVGYSTAEADAARRLRREFSLALLAGALLVALATSWFAFRVVVGRPLRRLLDDLAAARSEIERSGQARSEFLAAVSHDIRTPLNGVVALAEELRRDMSGPGRRELVDAICESGETLRGLVDDFLDLSRIDAGKFEFEETSFAPADLLSRVERAHAPMAARKGVGFHVETLGDCAAPVRGDPLRILQILHNLAGNAVKFTRDGEVRVTFDRTLPDTLGVVVADTGVGIARENLSRIFESYAQADAAVPREFGGSGLGLAIVRRLVDGMGGLIEVSSAPGRGAEFRVSIPVSRDSTPRAGPPSYEILHRSVADLRVLAVDDVATNRLVVEKLLERLDVSARVVDGGEEAIAAVEEEAFDAVLMDIAMPGMDGIAALAEIRAREEALGRAPAPAIAVTANALAHQVETYLAQGFDACIPKPIALDALAQALAQTRRGRHATPARASEPPPRAAALR